MTKWTRLNKDGELQTFDDREDGVWDTIMWWLLAPNKKKKTEKNQKKRKQRKKA